MSETIIGFRCNDFVLLAATGLAAHYYIKFSDTDDKIVQLDTHKMMAVSGENGARVNFSEYVKCNLSLNKVRSHHDETTWGVVNFMRNALANAIRSRGGAYGVNTLVAGYDAPMSEFDESTPAAHLYYMDYLGTLQEVPFAAHGYGTSFVTALLDRHWRPDLTAAEGVQLLQQCCEEVRKRVMISNAHFICRVVSSTGIETLPQVH